MRVLTLLSITLSAFNVSAADYKDIWWNPSQSGMGFNFAQVDDTLFGAWYFYGDDGKATFLTFSGQISKYALSGNLYRNTGPAPSARYDASLVKSAAVGTMQLNFNPDNRNKADFQYVFEGKSGTIPLERFSFKDNSASLNKTFDGEVFGMDATSPLPANFAFELKNGNFKLTRQLSNGNCIFEGIYTPVVEAISAAGTYRCTDMSSGNFSAPKMRVTEESVYVGQLTRTSSAGVMVTETHTGMFIPKTNWITLSGKTLDVSGASSACSNKDFRARYILQIGISSIVFTGADNVTTGTTSDPNFCTPGKMSTETIDIASLKLLDPSDPLVQCIPGCDVSTLNQTWTGTDVDGRFYRGTIKHVLGSNLIETTKQVLSNPKYPGVTQFDLWTETITIR
jgi:hypothetical protein